MTIIERGLTALGARTARGLGAMRQARRAIARRQRAGGRSPGAASSPVELAPASGEQIGRVPDPGPDRARFDRRPRWDVGCAPLVEPAGRDVRHLRIVRRHERSTPRPAIGPWGIVVGSEMAPGYVASGLLARDEHTETWVAWSVERQMPVRIRVPRHDPVTYAAFDQLRREHRTLSALGHPALAAAHDADFEAEMPYTVFEYVDSSSLAARVRNQACDPDPLEALRTGFELAAALDHLHRHEVVHLDLRSRHIRHRGGTVVITDAAAVRPAGSPVASPVTTTGWSSAAARRPGARADRRRGVLGAGAGVGDLRPIGGTGAASIPPERRAGAPADPAMDIYALGSLLQRVAEGPVVTAATADGLAVASLRSPIAVGPPALADTIVHMLAPDPADRPSAAEVVARFRPLLPAGLVRPHTVTERVRSRRLHLVPGSG